MKPLQARLPRSPVFATPACILTLASLGLAQAPITWTVKDIVDGATDVSTQGKPCIAVNLGPEVCEKVVNGVHFQADRSHWTTKILVRGGPPVRGQMYYPVFRSGGYTLTVPYNRTAPNIGPRHTTEADYDAILKDGRHNNGGTKVVTCTVDGLNPGSTYEVQIFYGNKGRPTRITEWDNGMGGREGKGGIFLRPVGPHFGQVATGTFKADASGQQSFSNYQQPADNTTNPPLKETHNATQAIQIRELTPTVLGARAILYGEGTPGTMRQPTLGGTNCSPAISVIGHPVMGTNVTVTAENSSGIANSALVVLGAASVSQPFLSGTLLVAPLLTVPVPMPIPQSPFVHDHELQLPISLTNTIATVYVQVLQLDSGAAGGVSFTPGVQIDIGF